MAKAIWEHAVRDDPIFNGEFVVSSPKSRSGSPKSTADMQKSTDGQADQKVLEMSLLPSDDPLQRAIDRFLDLQRKEADSLTRKEQAALDMLSTPISDAPQNGSSDTNAKPPGSGSLFGED